MRKKKERKVHSMKKTLRLTRLNRILALLMIIVLMFPMFSLKSEAADNATQAGAVGIDVSKYQGNIDWNGVRASGITFAFIKAYSFCSGIDPYFDRNIKGANAVGIRTGVYVYSYLITP